MRTLTDLVADLKIANSQPANRKGRRARAALSRRLMRHLMKRAKSHAKTNP